MFRDYNKIQLGDKATLTRTITDDDIRKFVELTGDDNRLHVDRDYAATTPFKDIVVHGMIGASFISTIIGTDLPGDGALWISQNLNFLLPVRLGDTLSIVCEVVSKVERERILVLKTTVENQNRQTVLSGEGQVKVLEVSKQEEDRSSNETNVAVVIGGAGGIGESISRDLAKMGYSVVVSYCSNQAKAERIVKDIVSDDGKAIALKADVSKLEDVQMLVQKTERNFGQIDLIVNNASPRISSIPVEDIEWENIQKHIDVQLKGLFNFVKTCVPTMKANKRGKIINITSQVLDSTPTSGWAAYAIGKACLATYSKSLATELGPFNVQVNCISPGMTETGFIGDIPLKARLIIARQTPLRRLADARDVSATVCFLASKEASYITGETIRVNGGQVMV